MTRSRSLILAGALLALGAVTPAWGDDWEDCQLGAFLAAGGHFDSAIRACTSTIKAGRPSREQLAVAYYNRGLAFHEKGDDARAIADLDTAITLKPGDSIPYLFRGIVHKDRGDFYRAIADFTKAIELQPDDGISYDWRGRAYEAQGELARALIDFRVAEGLTIESDPLHKALLASIAEIEAKLAAAPLDFSDVASTTPPTKLVLSSGTGIVVSAQGQVLTNNHVIDGCRDIIVRRTGSTPSQARMLYADKVNDLVLLKIEAQIADRDIAAIRTSPPVRAGEEIAVYGFPLVDVLSSSGNIVGGNISALAGLGDDVRLLQLTAPIQPGNSGGPLLDQSASVVGIVNAKLDEMKLVQESGEFPQNVNFAIKANVAVNFLEAHGVNYKTASGGDKLDLASVADIARRFTVLIVCQQ